MIKCCYKCTDRWVSKDSNCHSTCTRYLDAVKEEERKRTMRKEAQAGEQEIKAYKKQHYKSIDRRDQRAELLRRKKY